MNGAESLVKTMLASGLDVCFANPGTSEMHFVAALDSHPGMRCVLCLFEGGTSGAADGYFRMSGKPAATMLHLAPGFGNAFANLHNARKAGSGIVNVMGEHATHHLAYESPLRGDTKGIADVVSHWVRTAQSSQDVARDGAAAITAARSRNGQIATLILPADTAWGPGGAPEGADPAGATRRISPDRIAAAADQLAQPGAVFLVGGDAAWGDNLDKAARIAAKTGARLMAPLFTPRLRRGAGTPVLEQLAYPIAENQAKLAGTRHLVAIGTTAPVNFFAYPGLGSTPEPAGALVTELCGGDMDVSACLDDLMDATGAADRHFATVPLHLPDLPSGPLTPETAGQAIAALMPQDAIVVNEAVTSGGPVNIATRTARAHDMLATMGGAIGGCLPCATGAAIAAPQRKVIALSGDGSAMYTVQSLWTMARERLDVTVVIFANRTYRILHGEIAAMGHDRVGRNARAMFDLDHPALDWVALAAGHGVPAIRCETAEEFVTAFTTALETPGPYLIEAVI
ncbi:MAG: acetolactate synthase large subunit [Marinibacterium sp.]